MGAPKIKYKTIDEYISSFPKEIEETLQKLRQIIKEVAPTSQEKISYNMPSFILNNTYLIYFAGWKKHISIYPFTSDMEKSIKEAVDYKTSGKGTIQIPIDKPLPLPLIHKIIELQLKRVTSHK